MGISYLKKRKSPLNFTYFEFWVLEKISSNKKTSTSKTEKNEHHHRILHIQISLGTNFQLKITIFSISKKSISSLKQVKWTPPLNSVYSNWSLNQTLFWINHLNFWTKYAQKGFFGLKQKRWAPPLTSAYSNQSWYQISAFTDNFNFLDQICPKRLFLVFQISLGIKFQL